MEWGEARPRAENLPTGRVEGKLRGIPGESAEPQRQRSKGGERALLIREDERRRASQRESPYRQGERASKETTRPAGGSKEDLPAAGLIERREENAHTNREGSKLNLDRQTPPCVKKNREGEVAYQISNGKRTHHGGPLLKEWGEMQRAVKSWTDMTDGFKRSSTKRERKRPDQKKEHLANGRKGRENRQKWGKSVRSTHERGKAGRKSSYAT